MFRISLLYLIYKHYNHTDRTVFIEDSFLCKCLLGLSSKGQPEYLPTYEEMMFQDMLGCESSSMETQPDLDMSADLEQVTLQEYLFHASKPLHTDFVLPNQGKRSTCPV